MPYTTPSGCPAFTREHLKSLEISRELAKIGVSLRFRGTLAVKAATYCEAHSQRGIERRLKSWAASRNAGGAFFGWACVRLPLGLQ